MQSKFKTTEIEEGEVNFDLKRVEKQEESSSDDNLAFQLLDGEVMDNRMANFIGIHLLNDIIQGDDYEQTKNNVADQEPQIDS